MFFYKFCKIFKNIFLYRTPLVAASVCLPMRYYLMSWHPQIKYIINFYSAFAKINSSIKKETLAQMFFCEFCKKF